MTLQLTKFSKVIFTSDFLKVDDRIEKNYTNPNDIHGDWLRSLLSELIEPSISEKTTFNGEDINLPLNRFSFYSDLKIPFNTSGWASKYFGCDESISYLSDRMGFLKDSLVVGFELSPLIAKSLTRAKIPYIDLTIHAIRFLPDYIFGIRSNVPEIQERIKSCIIPPECISSHVAISKGRSARVYRNRKIDPGSVVFLGQIDIDSSLIEREGLVTQDEIYDRISELRAYYPKVYYKFHPHRKDRKEVEKHLTGSLGVDIIDANIYDLFDDGNIKLFASISSGALIEAALFGRNTMRMSREASPQIYRYDSNKDVEWAMVYAPVSNATLTSSFWSYILGNGDKTFDTTIPIPKDAMKFMINQKWGR